MPLIRRFRVLLLLLREKLRMVMDSNSITIPPAEERKSLFEVSAREAHSHKWLESEKAGRDLGDAAIAEWYRLYWRIFCRECYIEHLQGVHFWLELDSGDYGLLLNKFHDDMALVRQIVEIFKKGGENLDVVTFALNNNLNIEEVIRLLEVLDINARRIAPAVEITAKQFVEGIKASHHPRVLVVDDDPGTRELLRDVIEGQGVDCVTLETGEDALEEVQGRRFDMFIIDIMLPGKHGAEVAWYLKRHGVMCPVIAISAALDAWSHDDLLDCGFTDLMTKPLDIERLRRKTKEVRDFVLSDK